MVYFNGLATDPRYAPELLPLLVGEQARNGTYRYAPDGSFGEAVERARERARWGNTDEAWRTLMNALPLWEPLGPDHLAPLAWVADPLLGPLLTPERGEELLSTPRGGQRGAAPSPAAGTDPGGLAWLAEPDPGNRRTSYDDKAVMAVGRAGLGWSFAFDAEPAPFIGQRFVSPAGAASEGTRAVVVWGGLRAWHGEPFFHLSVARDGIEDYAFTYEDGEIRTSGAIPQALEPGRFFGRPKEDSGVERALLEAVGEEFGVRLPRHSLMRGRMHTFTTRSWTRPPGDGETYSVVRLDWGPALVADGNGPERCGPSGAGPTGG
jgi:hypothetical protein